MADNISNTNSGFATGGENPGFSNTPHFEGYEIRGETHASQAAPSSANPVESFLGGIGSLGSLVNIEGLKETATHYAGAYDKSLRANPYLHIGLAGAGALFLGYVLGRSMAPGASASAPIGAFDEGIDE